MTNGQVIALLDQMEAWLEDPTWEPETEPLAEWTDRFNAALAAADRGQGWEAVRERCHSIRRRLEQRLKTVMEARDLLRTELESQDRGARALKGYGAATR